MAYKALYRTYRPTTFEEVAGQQHIVKTLKNALEKGKIAHAYLFAGPRGTGKTTMAKLLAKALNCDEGIGNQCNECKNCSAINDGSHPDVLELDAASNNGVEEIRDIIDKVKYGTILGRYKVYIIDEVHMLSTGAFNALLKTLEEPPAHVIFILATTEPHKILPTILSRCQRYDFSKVSDNDIRDRIKVILDQENITYNEEAINLIISLADGGMRDALSILDQVLAYSGDKLDSQDILDIFSLESVDEKMTLLSSIASSDVVDVLDRLNNYISKGTDIKRLTNDLLIILKDLLIYQSSHNDMYLEILNNEQVNILDRIIDEKKTIKMIDILMEALKDYKNVSSINTLFEVTLLKLSAVESSERVVKPEIKKQPWVKQPMPKVEPVNPAPVYSKPIEKQEVSQPSLFDENVNEIKLDPNVIFLKEAEMDDVFDINEDLMIKVMVSGKKELKKELLENWDKIKKYIAHPTLGKGASLLVDGRPLVVTPKILILEFQLPKSAEKINLKDNQLALQNVISNVFGKKIFIYAVPRSDSVDLQNSFMNRRAIGTLPKLEDIKLEIVGE